MSLYHIPLCVYSHFTFTVITETPYSKERNLTFRKNDIDVVDGPMSSNSQNEHVPSSSTSSLNPNRTESAKQPITPTTITTTTTSTSTTSTTTTTPTTTSTTTQSTNSAGQDQVDDVVLAEDRRPANRKPTFIQVGEEILV